MVLIVLVPSLAGTAKSDPRSAARAAKARAHAAADTVGFCAFRKYSRHLKWGRSHAGVGRVGDERSKEALPVARGRKGRVFAHCLRISITRVLCVICSKYVNSTRALDVAAVSTERLWRSSSTTCALAASSCVTSRARSQHWTSSKRLNRSSGQSFCRYVRSLATRSWRCRWSLG